MDPTVQQNAIKVTKRGLSRSQVDPGWEPLDAFQGIVEVDDTVVILIAHEPVEMSQKEVELQERSDQNIGSCSNKRRWRKKLEPCIYANFTTLRKKVISCATPPDAFFTFIDDEMFDKMHYETYLKSVLKEKPASISKEEIKVFIGINLMMNYQVLPSIQHCWSTHDDLKVLPIQKAINRDRFQTILSNFHLNDNRLIDPDNRDKLYKVRPFLEHLSKVFIQNRSLNEYLCIDESMIRFKGRSTL